MEDNLSYEEICKLKERIQESKDNSIAKRNAYLAKLKDLTIDEIVEKFFFKNMRQDYADFCALYAENKLCHKLEPNTLNCFGCLCPNYNLDIVLDEETGLYKIGACRINSKLGYYKRTKTMGEYPKAFIVLTCIDCTVPHYKASAKKYITDALNNLS